MVSPLSPIQFEQPEKTNLAGSYLSGRQAYQNTQMNDQALKQGEQQISRADYDQAIQRLGVIHQLATKARSIANPQDRETFINSVNPEMLKSVGVDPAQVAQAPRDDNGLDALIAQTSAALPTSRLTGEAASFEVMTKGLSPADKESARRKALFLDAKPSGNVEIALAKDQALADIVRKNKEDTARGVATAAEGAKAAVELATRPDIAKETAKAENEAKSQAEAKSSLPKIKADADRAISLIDELLIHPGRNMATGSTAWVPAVPNTNQAGFISRFDQIKGQAFLQSFEALKGAGGITEKEGEKATEAVSRLNRATTRKEFDDAAEELKSTIIKLRDVAKEKASGGGGKDAPTASNDDSRNEKIKRLEELRKAQQF